MQEDVGVTTSARQAPGPGRPPSTTHDEVSRVALELFAHRGFEETTMEDIADALAIGRRTLFRYFRSKNDLVWGDFDWVLQRLRADFAALGRSLPLMEALRCAAVSSNTYPPEALPELRLRMTLITTVPALQAHSMLRYAEWRQVVVEFAAQRLRRQPDDFAPQAIGYAALAASTSAFTQWVRDPAEDLLALLDDSYAMLAAGFDQASIRKHRRAT
jgi:TetR/AcrR family transcriptional regulator, regulator of mycofactocin system